MPSIPPPQDENRYAATKGQHLLLKRAEIARAEVRKLGPLSDALLRAADAWERDNGRPFYYDAERVRDMVEEYKWRAETAEQERKRQKVRTFGFSHFGFLGWLEE